MDLGSIHIGDVVRWDDGRMQFGMVFDKESAAHGGCVMVKYLTRLDMPVPVRVKARHVTGHWRKSKATDRHEERRLAGVS